MTSKQEETEQRLSATEDQFGTTKSALQAEQSLRENTQTKLFDVQQRLDTEQTDHGETKDLLKTSKAKLDLITDALGAQAEEHPKCLEFRKFFNEFVNFSNEENYYERESDAILRLQAVEETMRLLGRVPLFREKTIIAVAGGFSSGKSSLITSFFDPKLKVSLPIGMDPVTAIPTYIACSSETSIIGFPAHGGTLDIAPEVFAQMRHDFLMSLGFDLRCILPFILLETPWRKNWEHLCFIDTPGYNAPIMGGLATAGDEQTTTEALLQADALLWVIGLDANGEISSDDLEYIHSHANGLPLAIVVNKADQRPPSQVQAVIEQIQETLDSYGIEYDSISAYSSFNLREYEYIGQSLDDFLATWNQQRPQRDQKLCQEVLDILNDYIKTFDEKIEHHARHKQELNSLKLDLDELGVFDEIDDSKTSKRKKGSVFDVAERLWSEAISDKKNISNSRRTEVKEKALDRLQGFSDAFAVEEIEVHKREALRLCQVVSVLFSQSWETEGPFT